jgi:arsenate reductase
MFYPRLQQYLEECVSQRDTIPNERRDQLKSVAEYVRKKIDGGQTAKLTFICTHNSRRSHLSQIWAHVAAGYYRLERIETYSGGTEGTAFNPRAVAAIERAGLRVEADDAKASNPRYKVFSSDVASPQICFSKVFDAEPNPTKDYCAVMTCSQADEACPVVIGCDLRAPIRYEDPKVADDTPMESERYDERSRQICTEMLYMMSLVATESE